MCPHIQAIVDGLLDSVSGTGQMDVIADRTHPLTSLVICEMLGISVSVGRGVHWRPTCGLIRPTIPDGTARRSLKSLDPNAGVVVARSEAAP